MKCRSCKSNLNLELIDLGPCPPSNCFVTESELGIEQQQYPLQILVCTECWLAQTRDFVSNNKLFNPDYVYMSSVSSSWLAHSEKLVDFLASNFQLDNDSQVLEIASNDGYLLQYFQRKGIPCTGIEPTLLAAEKARAKGIETITEFFGKRLADTLANSGKEYDVIIANNVLAHVPDVNDFICGIARVMKNTAIVVFEFPDLQNLIDQVQFDTIYHEHYSYFSLSSAKTLFERHGLDIFDCQKLETHGGSLRVFCKLRKNTSISINDSVLKKLNSEAPLRAEKYYSSFYLQAEEIRDELVKFLELQKANGKIVFGYGAAAKGNTLINYCAISDRLLPFIVDKSEAKVGLYAPGSLIPVISLERLKIEKPDMILILPWNLTQEIYEQLEFTMSWGAQLFVAMPKMRVLIR